MLKINLKVSGGKKKENQETKTEEEKIKIRRKKEEKTGEIKRINK